MSSGRAVGDRYPLTEAERSAFESDGWIRLPDFLDEHELAWLEEAYMALLRREVPVVGRDYCDMSGDYARAIEDFEILNVMLPRRYHPRARRQRVRTPGARRRAAATRRRHGSRLRPVRR